MSIRGCFEWLRLRELYRIFPICYNRHRVSDNSNLPEGGPDTDEAAARKSNCGVRRFWPFGVLVLIFLLGGNLWWDKRSQTSAQRAEEEHQFWVVCHGEFPAQERVAAFLELVAAGNKEWRAAHLYGLNLEGVFLPDADLHGADFTGSNLAGSIFAGANFAKGRLQQTDLTEADLSRANLAGTGLYKVVLKRAQLRQANLRGAGMQEAEAQNASLQAADLSDAYLLMADLSGANLSGANLEAALLRGANLFLTRLSGARLQDADFTDSNWWRVRGLASDQIALLKRNFAPTAEAAASLREDYENWLKKP